MAVRPADRSLYVLEKEGKIRVLTDGEVSQEPLLDISEEVASGGEQGLLGLAFSRDGDDLYIHFTDRRRAVRIRRYAFPRRGPIDPQSGDDILVVDKPFSQHNGGQLALGRDDHLWISIGDGGSAGDPFDNAQSTDSLLGKILRIDPATSGRRYRSPPDNPFADDPDARPEVWAYGLRNPWRFSFDRATGDLWIGDVGQNGAEEIDLEPAASAGGENYGWNRFEGDDRFLGGPLSGRYVFPLHAYRNTGNFCAVTGGYVYRGSKIPDLYGAYVFGDYCDGRLQALVQRNGKVRDVRFLGPRVSQLVSFGEDAEGEIYVFSLDGEVSRLEAG
jgi:glucose/arabinose dehydrogenase